MRGILLGLLLAEFGSMRDRETRLRGHLIRLQKLCAMDFHALAEFPFRLQSARYVTA
jgi:hypothetical protein